VEFRILGPLEIVNGPGLPLDAPKLRALLGVLLLHPNEVVSSQRLIDELWGERQPATAPKLIQTYVSQLRRGLGPNVIATRAPGYVLQLDERALDVERFRRLVADARRLAAGGQEERARQIYRRALALWRGPPLADISFESFARNEVERLEEERLSAVVDLVDCELALGHHAELVPELETLVREQPVRERLRALLMVALYRSGRQADALAVYQDARRTLVEELGLEPGHELQDLERAILTHDPALEPPPRHRTGIGSFGRPSPALWQLAGWRAAAVVIAIVLALALVLAFALRRPEQASMRLAPNSVGFIDAKSRRVTKSFSVGREPRALAVAFDSVWVANYRDTTVTRIDRTTGRHSTIPVVGHPTDIAAFGTSIWVWTLEGLLVPIDPRFDSHGDPIHLAAQAPNVAKVLGGIASGGGFLWVADPPTTIIRVDPAHPSHSRTIVPDAGVQGPIDFGDGETWVAGSDKVFPIDPATGIVRSPIAVGIARDLEVTNTDLLVVSGETTHLGAVVQALRRVDIESRLIEDKIMVGNDPASVIAMGGSIWVASGSDGLVSRIDPGESQVAKSISVGASPTALAADENGVWVAVR
jgi:DNA-binding SARP family transcriptional activator/DNA-binding beta-propeller fold protein YncE